MLELGKESFDFNWKFCLSDKEVYAKKSFNDSGWRSVTLPHDWSIEGHYEESNPAGKRGGFLPTGSGWYRKTLILESVNTTFVEFDGIYRNAIIYINGVKVKEHGYGYTSFRVDITKFLKIGENVIAIRVDDLNCPSSRWYNGCGIYRHTWIIEKGEGYLLPETFIYTKERTETYTLIHMDYQATIEGSVEIFIEDREKNIIGNVSHTGKEGSVEIKVEDPILWNLESPYLYEVRLVLKNVEGNEVDHQSWKFGIREFIFDKDHGLFLNDTSVKIQGVCLHHDAGGLGAAVPNRILRNRLLQLKRCGINGIRTGHTPFAPEFYDMCDEIGIMVMDEMFDGWHKKAPYDYGAEYFANSGKKDLIEFIKRDRNHPCVMMWGIGNETGDTDVYGLTEVCHSVDFTRKVSGGQLLFGTDVIGLNGSSEAPGYLEKLKLQDSSRPVLLAEYPHCYSTRGFYRTKTWWRDYGRPRYDISNYSEEEIFDGFDPKFSKVVCYNSSYDNATCRISNKEAWKRAKEFQHVIGMFMWTGFDYLGESFGWPYRSLNCGIIDLAGFEKDSYYFYQSQWAKGPMIHMLPSWSLDVKEGTLIPVVVYSNCEEVELFLNGESLGKRKMDGVMELLWHVPYISGRLEVVGIHKDGTVIRDKKETESTVKNLVLNMKDDLINDGQDVVELVVSTVDKNGIFCTKADNTVYFDVQGGADFKAADNGDPFDLQANTKPKRKLFYGLAKVYIGSNLSSNKVTITACAALGNTYFLEETMCSLSVEQVVINCDKAKNIQIYYSLDGSNPEDGIQYSQSFKLTDSCVVKAVAILDKHKIFFESEFIKGKKTAMIEELEQPRDKVLLGEWTSKTDERKFVFFENGVVDVYVDGVKVREASWWYETPIDKFESDTGDLDCGEILFPFDNFLLKVMDNGSLRHRNKEDKEGSVCYFTKTI